MSNSISKLAFYLVSYNFIISVILISKIALQFAFFGVMLLIGKTVGEMEIALGALLTLIASLVSIIIGIMYFIKRARMQFEKIKRIQTIKALFVVIIMALIAPPLSLITLFFLIFINA